MAREDFLKGLDVRNFKHEEEIDGVKIVHTGLKDEMDMEIIEIYDDNGNRWYTNCPSIEGAQKIVERLKADGKEAVIGPKAPGRKKDGTLVKSPREEDVGVYIVKTIEEKEESKDGIEPAE